jgi:hypothetical protein
MDNAVVTVRLAASAPASLIISIIIPSHAIMFIFQESLRRIHHRYLMALSGFGLVANTLLAAPASSPPFAFAATGAASSNQNIAVTKDAMDRIDTTIRTVVVSFALENVTFQQPTNAPCSMPDRAFAVACRP